MSSSKGENNGDISSSAMVKALQAIPKQNVERARLAIHFTLVAEPIMSSAELLTAVGVACGATHHDRFYLSPEQDSITIPDSGALKDNPMLKRTADDRVLVTSTSVKTFLSQKKLPHDLRIFAFDPVKEHAELARTMLKYLSFNVFDKTYQRFEDDPDLRGHLLLRYATYRLVHHCTYTRRAPIMVEQLIQFARSTNGWRWYQRLVHSYEVDEDDIFSYHNILQEWIEFNGMDKDEYDVFRIIAGSRYDQLESLPKEDAVDYEQSLWLLCNALAEFEEKAALLLAFRWNVQSRLYGKDAKATIETLLDIAHVHSRAQNYQDAFDAFALAREKIEKMNDDRSSDVLELLAPMASLGQAFIRRNEFRLFFASEQIWRFVHIHTKALRGEEHDDLVTAAGNLAVSLSRLERFDEALPMQERLLQIALRKDGRQTAKVLTCMTNLAKTLHSMGRLDDAEKMEREVVEAHKACNAPDDPEIGSVLWNLAITVISQKRWAEAEALMRETLEARKLSLGPNHRKTGWAESAIGMSMLMQNKDIDAERWLQDSYSKRRNLLSPDDGDTLYDMSALAWALAKLGRNDEASDMAMKAARKLLSPGSPCIVDPTRADQVLEIIDSALDTIGGKRQVDEIAELLRIRSLEAEEQAKRDCGHDQEDEPSQSLAKPLASLDLSSSN